MPANPVGNRGPDLKMSKEDMSKALKVQMSPKAAIQRNCMNQMIAKMRSKGSDD